MKNGPSLAALMHKHCRICRRERKKADREQLVPLVRRGSVLYRRMYRIRRARQAWSITSETTE